MTEESCNSLNYNIAKLQIILPAKNTPDSMLYMCNCSILSTPELRQSPILGTHLIAAAESLVCKYVADAP